MGTSIKGNKITSAPSIQDSNPSTLDNISGSLSSDKRVSNSGFDKAAQYDIKENFKNDKYTNIYYYDRTVEAESYTKSAPIKRYGAPSIFNRYAIITHPGFNSYNDFLDINGSNNIFPKHTKNKTGGRELTLESVLSDFDPDGGSFNKNLATPYYASDFLYSAYAFQNAELNRLITLRRFPFPTFDNLKFAGDKSFRPIAQAVTFFGEGTENKLSELAKMSGYINWEEIEAQVHDVEGNEQGYDSTPFIGGSKIGKAFNAITNPSGQDLGGFKAEQVEAAKYNTFDYTNKVLGPVNVVHKTNVRKRGIGATYEVDVVFEYRLMSYNNINPRIAMIDLLSNLLALSFNNAKFWGGANRYFPQVHQFGFFGDQEAFYSGRYGDYMDSVINQITEGFGNIGAKLGDLFSGILSGDFSVLKKMATATFNTAMDLRRAKSRPKVLAIHSLLSGAPVGEWHLTVGNPYRPIMTIGNLICTGFDFEFGDELGVDDFPTSLKYTIKLKNGRPRDKGDVESMFNMGNGRTYYPPKGLIDINNVSSAAGTAPNTMSGGKSKKGGDGKKNTKSLTPAVPSIPGDPYRNIGRATDNDYAKKATGSVF